MDKRQQVLDQIAAQEIPADTDIWPAIAARVKSPRPQRFAYPHLGRAAAALTVLLLVGAVSAYALVQSFFQPDPGLDGIQAAALVTEIGQSQTIDGKTVTLDWAFADGRRVATHLTVEGVGNGQWPRVETLTDSSGLVLPRTSGSPAESSGDLSWVQNFSLYAPAPGSPEGAVAEDVRHLEAAYGGTLPDSLSLEMTVYLERGDRLTGPYTFTFEVPLRADQLVLDSSQSQVINGETVTLDRLVVTTSQTVATVCYTHPAGRWGIRPTLQMGGETVDVRGIRDTQSPSEGETCAEVEFNAYFDETVDEITLTVPSLVSQQIGDRDFWQRVVDAAAAEGIEITTHDNSYDLIAYPDDMTAEEAGERLLDIVAAQRGDIDGPWVFTVPVE